MQKESLYCVAHQYYGKYACAIAQQSGKICSILIEDFMVNIALCIYSLFQVQFVRNITEWKDIKPALYHGHMAYLDFSK